MSSNGRLTSGPRTDGTMQKAQELSHPVWMLTHAAYGSSRTAPGPSSGSVPASGSGASRISISGPSSCARRSRTGARAQVVRAEHDVDPAHLLLDPLAVLLGQAAADGDLQAGLGVHQLLQPAERPVEPLVGVLPDAARVEHHDVGVLHGGRRLHAVGHEQAGQALRVVLVHLAPERADEISPRHPHESREAQRIRSSAVAAPCPRRSPHHRLAGCWRRCRWPAGRLQLGPGTSAGRPGLGELERSQGADAKVLDHMTTTRRRRPRASRPRAPWCASSTRTSRSATRSTLRQPARGRQGLHRAAERHRQRAQRRPRRSPTASRSWATPSPRSRTTTRSSTRST